MNRGSTVVTPGPSCGGHRHEQARGLRFTAPTRGRDRRRKPGGAQGAQHGSAVTKTRARRGRGSRELRVARRGSVRRRADRGGRADAAGRVPVHSLFPGAPPQSARSAARRPRRLPGLLLTRTVRAPAAAGLRFYFPTLAVGTDVHVTTPEQAPVPVPPVALDSHPLTV